MCIHSGGGLASEAFSVRVHPGGEIDARSGSYRADVPTIEVLDPDNWSIPLTSGEGWNLAQELAGNDQIGRLDEFGATPSSGEIVFNEAFRKYITETPTDTLILRGSHVQRYETVDEAKQGTPMYLKKEAYLRDATEGSKAFDFKQPRVVYQECAAIDNWRRVIAAYLPAGHVCGHKICYFKDYKCPPMTLLGIFNSSLIDWFVTTASTNNSLPAYLVGALPFPKLESSDNTLADRDLVETYQTLMHEVERKTSEQAAAWAKAARLPGPISCSDHIARLSAFVGHLAGEMVKLHKFCGHKTKAFLDVIGSALQPREAATSIQKMPGNMTLKNFRGDYQKAEPHLSFERIWSVIERAPGGKLRSSASNNREKIRDAYHGSLEVLLPLKSRMAATDTLIDRVVYHLYGLTDEQSRAIEEARRSTASKRTGANSKAASEP